MTAKVLLSLREDQVEKLDALVTSGAAPSRSALVSKIIGGFLADLKEERNPQDTATGNLIGFLLLLLGTAAVIQILGGKK